MRNLGKLNLKEMEKNVTPICEVEQAQLSGGASVCINVYRIEFGAETTVSYYTAIAYNDAGLQIGSTGGFFLEPAMPTGSDTTDTAIPYGDYEVVPSTYHGQSGFFEVANVPGRTDIKIHSGNTADDTSGCFLPGTNFSGDGTCENDYRVNNSTTDRTELFNFLNTYGSNCITMKIR